MKLARIVPALLALSLLPNLAHAFGNANAKVLLHLTQTFTSQQCTRAEANPPCEQVDTSGGLYPTLYFAHVLVADGSASEGIAGLVLGIDYDAAAGVGVDVFGWTLCATLELATGGFPSAGGGDLITWNVTTRCQRNEPGGPGTGVVAHAGYFYCASYGNDTMRIIPYHRAGNRSDKKVVIANCASQEDVIVDETAPPNPSPLGSVAFSSSGTTEGSNPCQKVVAIESTTWGRIKSGLTD